MSGNKDTLEIDNSTAGMADAYWYEWYVGLDNVLDMLNTKNNIDHVILQHEKLQGLDDVVVKYTDKTAKCIQVKHTRTGEKISFSNLVYFTQNKESLLKKTAKDWLRARKLYGECNAILYTNRKAGSDYEVKMRNMDNYIRPDLKIFYETLKIEISKINKLEQFSENHQEWDVAWKEWCTQLECIKKESDKIEFIKCLEIKTEEKDLKETVESVVHKLEESFDISNSIARQLEMKLCYALKTWTTSLRQRQEITKEKLYEALSINDDEEVGVHNITPQEPIFKSRTEFANNLSNTLAKREKPVIFLSGEPGCGKTNVVSDLAQRSESVISMRFYTFKPLTLKDNYLSPDGGIYEARSLWGNLLIGLRRLLKGNLEKYNVPPVNDFLDTIEKMRSKVLELAQCLAELTGETTVIAIDGIDHAVRSGESSSYLKTLPEPQLIPDNVCFLIAGQLMTNTDYYPDWLTDENRVLQCEVPPIDENDIEQIYNYSDIKLPIENKNDIIRLINNKCSGNTLAIMFAIKEAENCNNVEELEVVFNNKRLSEGIIEYYEYVWKNAIKNIPKEYAYLENILAGVLSLLNKHITPEMLVEICNELSINKYIWKNVLDSLFPIIVRNKESYSAYHNDIRVYLEKRIKRNLSNYQEANSMIAEYLFSKCKDIKLVHENVFRFLSNAHRERDFSRVFTYQYVYDAIKNKRPWNEIINQLNSTLKSVQNSFGFEDLVSLTCSVSTLFQYKETLNWISKEHIEEKKLPELLNSEKKVYNKKFWTLDRIETLFSDLLRLIEFGEMERANVLYERWLDNINPEQLYDLIIINVPECGVTDEVNDIIENFGFICRYIGIKFQIPNPVNDNLKENGKKIRGCFSKGWLEAGSNLYTEKEIKETIRLINDLKIVNTKSFEEYVNKLVKNNLAESLKISHYPICDKFSCSTKIDFLVTAIIYKNELPQKWIEDILEFGITYVDRRMFLGRDFLPVFCKLIFVLEYIGYPFEKEDSLIEYFYLGRDICQDEITIFISIINKYKYLASFYNTSERKKDTDVIIFERYVYDTFNYNIRKMNIFNIDVEKLNQYFFLL